MKLLKLAAIFLMAGVLSGCYGHYDDCHAWHIDIEIFDNHHHGHHHPHHKRRHCR